MKKFFRVAVILIASGLLLISVVFSFMFFTQETETLTDKILSEAPGKFVSLKHGQVHYRLQGSDSAKLILFIPGGGISGCEVFDPLISEFTRNGYRTLTYDLYGRGYSPRPEVAHSPEFFQEQLASLLDSLNITEPIHIVSMSMGAIIGMDYFVNNPARVNKIVFIDPSLDGQFKGNPLLKFPVISDVLLTMYWYPKAAENQRKEFVNQEVFEDYKKRLEYFMNFKGYKYANYSTWFNMLTVNKLQGMGTLPDSSVLLIYGKNDPYFPGDRSSVLYKGIYPTLQVAPIDQAGHIPHLEKPLEVTEAINSFLK